jgi:eukaryotic-like serine/threonine-protein kinase
MMEPADMLSGEAEETLDGLRPPEELLRLWQRGERPDVDRFLADHRPLTPLQVAAVLSIDQGQRWQGGERIRAEQYLSRYPELRADPEAVVDLIYQEFLLRERLGEHPALAEYVDRFPDHAEPVRALIFTHKAMQQPVPPRPVTVGAALDVDKTVAQSKSPLPLQAPLLPLRGATTPLAMSQTQELLRRRLRATVIVFLFAGLVPLGEILQLWMQGKVSKQVHIQLLSSGTAYLVVFFSAALLWRRQELTLAGLRRLELLLFGMVALLFAINHYLLLRDSQLLPYAAIGIAGIVNRAKSLSVTWFGMIVVYGMFIPNTGKRCAAVASVIALFPLTAAAFAVADQSLEQPLARSFVLTLGGILVLAVVIAVSGSHRLYVLQQEARAARKLGPYKLQRRLGAGGMGEVYLAEHVLLRRPCAIKLIKPERANNSLDLRRFEREVQATATLTHPNTVQVFDYGHANDGTFYFAMEYLPGLNLQELIEQTGPLPVGRALHLLLQVCGALKEAHSVGLIHRDIKPNNIIVGQRGGIHDVAKLLDFGLVRMQNPQEDETKLTQEGTIAGTPAFMSPEQAISQDNLDGRSDIYSLGALAYFLLTGQPPFTGRSAVQVLAAHLHQQPEPLTAKRPELDVELQDIVLRCLAKEPGKRYANIGALEETLEVSRGRHPWSAEDAAAWWGSR